MDSFAHANTSRLRQSMPPPSKVFCVISHENINNRQKRTPITHLTEEQNEQIVGSCLFLKTDVLDYNLVPSFPNYLYAYTSLLVPEFISRRHYGGIIRLTMCVLCTLLALFFMMMELRQSFDACMENKELYNYVILLNSVLSVLTGGQVLNIILRKRKLLLRTFWHPISKEYIHGRRISTYDLNTSKTCRAAKTFLFGLLIIGLFQVGTDTFDNVTDWTLTELLQHNAYYLVKVIGAVPARIGINTTMPNTVFNSSDERIQLETVLLGSVGCALQLASFLMISYSQGLVLFAGRTMKEVSEKFISLLNVPSPDGRKIKHTYEFMFRSTCSLDISIGELLAVHHIQVFLYFVLVLRVMLADGVAIDLLSFVRFLPDFALTAAIYYYATRAPIMINAFRSWIRIRENQENLRLDVITIQNLFDELNTNPSGIGKGIFYVNAELIAKLLSSIGTFFLVIATRTE